MNGQKREKSQALSIQFSFHLSVPKISPPVLLFLLRYWQRVSQIHNQPAASMHIKTYLHARYSSRYIKHIHGSRFSRNPNETFFSPFFFVHSSRHESINLSGPISS